MFRFPRNELTVIYCLEKKYAALKFPGTIAVGDKIKDKQLIKQKKNVRSKVDVSKHQDIN